MKEKLERAERLVGLVFVLAIILFLAAFLASGRGCSVAPKTKEITVVSTSVVTVTATGTDTNPDTGGGRTDGKKDCREVTTFDELQPVIAVNCAGCHARRDTFDEAKRTYAEMVRRISLGQNDPGHMPAGKPKLSEKDLSLFEGWGQDGFLRPGDCVGGGDNGGETTAFVTFAALEDGAFRDASSVPEVDQKDIAYLSYADRIDAGAGLDELAVWKKAAAKGVNSVSTDRAIRAPVEVSAGLLRINIRDLGISPVEWKQIENASLLNFESQTARGKALKAITGKRLPILEVAEFNDIVLRNASVYYDLTEAPLTFNQLTINLGVDYAADLAGFRALLVGFNGSLLSPAANRLMARHDSADGFFWSTYDTGPIVSDAQNLFKNPLLKEAGGNANLKFAAGEQLYTLPNGLIGSFLSDAAGKRLDFADPNVVSDFTSNPLRPFIRNAVSCFRCHNGGIIRTPDQVRDRGFGGIGAANARIAEALFKQQQTVDVQIQRDNDAYSAALGRLGIDPADPDPITRVSDKFLGDLDIKDVAGLFKHTVAEITQCIEISDEGRQEAAQLLSPRGTLSHDQFLQVKDALIKDCGLLEDPLTGDGK